MYNLVSRITDGLGELKKLLETHIHNQGLAAIEKCGEAALNVGAATPPPHRPTHATRGKRKARGPPLARRLVLCGQSESINGPSV